MTHHYRDAYNAYRAGQLAAEAFHDPDLTADAVEQRKATARAAARARLLEAIPAEPAHRDDPRAATLDALRPRSADDVAVYGREWAKVRAAVERGQSLTTVIDSADVTRCAAILDSLEDDPGVNASPARDDVIAELRARVFDRLASIGHPDAVTAQAAIKETATTEAWRATLTGLATGNLDYGTRVALRTADPDGYSATIGHDAARPEAATIARLDTLTHREATAD